MKKDLIFNKLFYSFLKDYSVLIKDCYDDVYLSEDYQHLKAFLEKINLLGYSIFYTKERKYICYKDLFVEAYFIIENDSEIKEHVESIRSVLREDPYLLVEILDKCDVLSAIKDRFEQLLLDDYDNIMRDLEALKRDVKHSS